MIWKFIVRTLAVSFALALLLVAPYLPGPVGATADRLRILVLFSLGLLVVPLLVVAPLYFYFYRQGKLRFSGFLMWGMAGSAFLVLLVVAILLTAGPFPQPIRILAAKDEIPGTISTSSFLGFLATVFTLWAAASSAFVLISQLKHEESSQEAMSYTLAGLRQVDQSEALDEVKLWTENPNVDRVTFFGAFSLIPGFWQQPNSEAYNLIYGHLFGSGKPPLSLIGPDLNGIRSLATYLTAPEQKKKLEEMATWSVTARQLSNGGEEAVAKLVDQYSDFCDSLDRLKATVKRAPIPWETSAITFAVARDKYSNPIAAIFFGSPIPRDGLAPGEIANVFRKPFVFVTRRDEICSLLINLAYVIDRKFENEIDNWKEGPV